MKKRLPIIIVLLSFSLLGLIGVNFAWFDNLLEVRQNQIFGKIKEGADEVANDLSKSAYNSAIIKLPRKLNGLNTIDLTFKLLKPPSIDEKFTAEEIYNKLNTAFISKDAKNLKFEFAVLSSEGEIEMQSANFTPAFNEQENKKIHTYIVPETGTDLDGIAQAEQLIVVVPSFKIQVWKSLLWVIILAVLFIAFIFFVFFYTVKEIINQKKLTKIKSDFINNMTHEFKTPIATISLAVDALKNEKVKTDETKANFFISIIKDENIRMNKQVEKILEAALLEKKELQLKLKELHVHESIKEAIDKFKLQLEEKKATIFLQLSAQEDIIQADDTHFFNVLSNLIDNAIKYSKENLNIQIATTSTNDTITIVIEDNGIGMSKETMKRLFEQFYRAHTGNVHNVKGFGLGMSYVKTIVEALKGKIKVESTLEKGTAFTLEFPLKKES